MMEAFLAQERKHGKYCSATSHHGRLLLVPQVSTRLPTVRPQTHIPRDADTRACMKPTVRPGSALETARRRLTGAVRPKTNRTSDLPLGGGCSIH